MHSNLHDLLERNNCHFVPTYIGRSAMVHRVRGHDFLSKSYLDTRRPGCPGANEQEYINIEIINIQ